MCDLLPKASRTTRVHNVEGAYGWTLGPILYMTAGRREREDISRLVTKSCSPCYLDDGLIVGTCVMSSSASSSLSTDGSKVT